VDDIVHILNSIHFLYCDHEQPTVEVRSQMTGLSPSNLCTNGHGHVLSYSTLSSNSHLYPVDCVVWSRCKTLGHLCRKCRTVATMFVVEILDKPYLQATQRLLDPVVSVDPPRRPPCATFHYTCPFPASVLSITTKMRNEKSTTSEPCSIQSVRELIMQKRSYCKWSLD